MQDGRTLTTDGPFVETKESIGGYLIFEADDLDAAIELAARIPAARLGGAIEVRPSWSGDGSSSRLSGAVGPRPRCPLGFLGDFDLAEEATQEAFAIAAERWPATAPRHPGAWLITTARNRRSTACAATHAGGEDRLLQVPEAAEDEMDATTFPDERLELIFTCCHPALAVEAQVALTLRSLGGLTTGRSPGRSSCRRRRWRSAWCERSARSSRRDPVPRAARTCCPNGSPPCSRSST